MVYVCFTRLPEKEKKRGDLMYWLLFGPLTLLLLLSLLLDDFEFSCG